MTTQWSSGQGEKKLDGQPKEVAMVSTVAEEWAKYLIRLKFGDLPPEAVHQAKRVLIDTLGCAIGGYGSQASNIVQSVVEELGGPRESTVIGSGFKTSCLHAALANGVMLRYLDFNDVYIHLRGNRPEGTHPSEIIPAILAIGEKVHSSGEEIITAIILGYELSARFVDSIINRTLEQRGWNSDSRGIFVVPAIVGKLLNLYEKQIANAIGISASHNLVLGILDAPGEEYTMTKNLRFPRVAYGGIFSALLAQRGFTGPIRVMEGNKGFAQVVLQNELDLEKLVYGDQKLRILETNIKSFCSDYTMQGHLTATLELLKAHDIKPEDITQVRVWAGTRDVEHTGDEAKRYPANKESADHSSYYAQSIIIIDHTLGPEQYTPEKYANPQVRELSDKVVFRADPSLDSFVAAGIVEIDTVQGRQYRRRVDYPRGHHKNPMTDEELFNKFRATVSRFMTDKQISMIIDTVFELEKLVDINELTSKLRCGNQPISIG